MYGTQVPGVQPPGTLFQNFVRLCRHHASQFLNFDRALVQNEDEASPNEVLEFAQKLPTLIKQMRPSDIIKTLEALDGLPLGKLLHSAIRQSPLATLDAMGALQQQIWDRFFQLAVEMIGNESQPSFSERIRDLCLSLASRVNESVFSFLRAQDNADENDKDAWSYFVAYAPTILTLARDALCSEAYVREFMGHSIIDELFSMLYSLSSMKMRGRALARQYLSVDAVGKIWYHQEDYDLSFDSFIMAWHIRPRDRDSSSERQRLARNIAHWKAFFKPFVSAADPEDIRNQEARAQLVAQMSKMIAQRPKSGFEKAIADCIADVGLFEPFKPQHIQVCGVAVKEGTAIRQLKSCDDQSAGLFEIEMDDIRLRFACLEPIDEQEVVVTITFQLSSFGSVTYRPSRVTDLPQQPDACFTISLEGGQPQPTCQAAEAPIAGMWQKLEPVVELTVTCTPDSADTLYHALLQRGITLHRDSISVSSQEIAVPSTPQRSEKPLRIFSARGKASLLIEDICLGPSAAVQRARNHQSWAPPNDDAAFETFTFEKDPANPNRKESSQILAEGHRSLKESVALDGSPPPASLSPQGSTTFCKPSPTASSPISLVSPSSLASQLEAMPPSAGIRQEKIKTPKQGDKPTLSQQSNASSSLSSAPTPQEIQPSVLVSGLVNAGPQRPKDTFSEKTAVAEAQQGRPDSLQPDYNAKHLGHATVGGAVVEAQHQLRTGEDMKQAAHIRVKSHGSDENRTTLMSQQQTDVNKQSQGTAKTKNCSRKVRSHASQRDVHNDCESIENLEDPRQKKDPNFNAHEAPSNSKVCGTASSRKIVPAWIAPAHKAQLQERSAELEALENYEVQSQREEQNDKRSSWGSRAPTHVSTPPQSLKSIEDVDSAVTRGADQHSSLGQKIPSAPFKIGSEITTENQRTIQALETPTKRRKRNLEALVDEEGVEADSPSQELSALRRGKRIILPSPSPSPSVDDAGHENIPKQSGEGVAKRRKFSEQGHKSPSWGELEEEGSESPAQPRRKRADSGIDLPVLKSAEPTEKKGKNRLVSVHARAEDECQGASQVVRPQSEDVSNTDQQLDAAILPDNGMCISDDETKHEKHKASELMKVAQRLLSVAAEKVDAESDEDDEDLPLNASTRGNIVVQDYIRGVRQKLEMLERNAKHRDEHSKRKRQEAALNRWSDELDSARDDWEDLISRGNAMIERINGVQGKMTRLLGCRGRRQVE